MSGRPPLFAAHPPLSLLAEAKVCHLLQAAKNGVFVCPKNLLTKIGFRVNKTNALICREENDVFVQTKRCFPIGSAACVCCGFWCCTSLCVFYVCTVLVAILSGKRLLAWEIVDKSVTFDNCDK